MLTGKPRDNQKTKEFVNEESPEVLEPYVNVDIESNDSLNSNTSSSSDDSEDSLEM